MQCFLFHSKRLRWHSTFTLTWRCQNTQQKKYICLKQLILIGCFTLLKLVAWSIQGFHFSQAVPIMPPLLAKPTAQPWVATQRRTDTCLNENVSRKIKGWGERKQAEYPSWQTLLETSHATMCKESSVHGSGLVYFPFGQWITFLTYLTGFCTCIYFGSL